MPRKIRELEADLRRAGFVWRPAKGSHTVWTHPLLPGVHVTISGNDGSDARDFHEREVRQALARLRAFEEQQR